MLKAEDVNGLSAFSAMIVHLAEIGRRMPK
jgi:hypothetical protein